MRARDALLVLVVLAARVVTVVLGIRSGTTTCYWLYAAAPQLEWTHTRAPTLQWFHVPIRDRWGGGEEEEGGLEWTCRRGCSDDGS
jgi:hypothetical protein